MQMKDKRHPLCATGMVVDASRKMQMKDNRHSLRAKSYLILYMGGLIDSSHQPQTWRS